ncbi:MAG TPA: hypothetical protein VMB80_16265 [Candidatus Acidoferrum sp.]|nr:hypothetical protein [Candidatus Acidoferrum sp.]
MMTLRRVHLYLGCTFAPMLIFFAVSGLWQMGLRHNSDGTGRGDSVFAWLSTIHTGHPLKAGTLSSAAMTWLVTAMAASLVVTVLLGVVMAFKFGSRRAAAACLVAGIVLPTILALLAWKQ